MKKLTVAILFIFIFLFFIKATAFAADLNINCSSGCTKSGTDPLFSKNLDGVWYPGKEVTKVINLTNSATESKEMTMKANRTSSLSMLEDKIYIEISNPLLFSIIWQGSLANFYNQGKISFGTFAKNQSTDFNFKANMDSNADNSYQGLESVFDLKLGFWQENAQSNTSNTSGAGDGLSDGRSDGLSDGKSSAASGISTSILGAVILPVINNLQDVLGANSNPVFEKQNIANKDLGIKTNSEYISIKKSYFIGFLLFIILILLYIFRKRLKAFLLRNTK